jgi:hypothetical protein
MITTSIEIIQETDWPMFWATLSTGLCAVFAVVVAFLLQNRGIYRQKKYAIAVVALLIYNQTELLYFFYQTLKGDLDQKDLMNYQKREHDNYVRYEKYEECLVTSFKSKVVSEIHSFFMNLHSDITLLSYNSIVENRKRWLDHYKVIYEKSVFPKSKKILGSMRQTEYIKMIDELVVF